MDTLSPGPSPSPSPVAILQSVSTDPNIAQIVTAVAAVLALTGIFLAWLSAARARHAALMADISKRWDEPLLVESRQLAARFDDPERFRRHFGDQLDKDTADLYALKRLPNFFEDLAVLEWAKAISFRLIRESLGLTIVDAWDMWKPAVEDMRMRYRDKHAYDHFEGLAEKMRRKIPPTEADPNEGI